ncbi:DUF1343 domain-containing protein [Compostibacter hankyongensis]|uniref:DUF1343 domain-containing protein n=1 Tax=Compostibacter hankyongensis TaxID=1007089 RepID=A0ABP8G428_9BACT
MRLILFFLPLLIFCAPHIPDHAEAARRPQPQKILTGADQTEKYLPLLDGKRVGLLVNQTSLVGEQNLVDTLLKRGVKIVKIFGPEHGFRGNADAGETVGNSTDPATGLPVISLYGKHNKPTSVELTDVDVMLYDIQDVGARFYTYISSMQRFMEAAAENHKPFIILDRPNPNGFYVDGPVLDLKFRSGVGPQPIPIVYGMTIGEYARMLIGERWLSSPDLQPELTVIPCRGYTHRSRYTLPVRPSPNLPDMTSVYLYPSLCFFEGTDCSVGRGTDRPFQVFGRPDFPPDLYAFTPRSRPGAKNPPQLDKRCYGFLAAASPEEALRETGGKIQLKWLLEAYRLAPDKDHFFNAYFNKLAGNDALMQQVKAGWSAEKIRASWAPELTRFKEIRQRYLLYP